MFGLKRKKKPKFTESKSEKEFREIFKRSQKTNKGQLSRQIIRHNLKYAFWITLFGENWFHKPKRKGGWHGKSK